MTAYSTVADADTYFASRLYVTDWTGASTSNKTIALAEATQRIDRLRFRGEKVDDTQDLEFPRYYGDEAEGDEVIPDDIKIACYELALALLAGKSPEVEAMNQAISSRTFGSVSTSYKDSAVFEHLAAGIPSQLAWQYLRPYLARNNSIFIFRVS